MDLQGKLVRVQGSWEPRKDNFKKCSSLTVKMRMVSLWYKNFSPVKVRCTWVFTTYHDPQPLCHFSPKVMAAATYLKQFPISWLLVFKRVGWESAAQFCPPCSRMWLQVWTPLYKHPTCPHLGKLFTHIQYPGLKGCSDLPLALGYLTEDQCKMLSWL